MNTEHVVIEAYEKAEAAVLAMAETAADEIATRAISRAHIKTIVDAAAPIIRRTQRFQTHMALERLAQAAEAYLTRPADPGPSETAEHRQHLGEALTDAWMLLRPNMAGEGSDGNRPTDGPAQPLAGEQAEPVRQDAGNTLRASEAVPPAAQSVPIDAFRDATEALAEVVNWILNSGHECPWYRGWLRASNRARQRLAAIEQAAG